jgi:copper(I)-binding protein
MKTPVITAFALAAAMLCTPAIGHEYYATSFKVIHPWAEPTVPGAKSAEVYMKIEQISEGDQLLSAHTSLAERVELHAGRVTAAPLAAITLPPGPDINLDVGRGYLHLVNLTAPLQWGRSYPMTLVFEKSGPVDVMISVGAH